MRFLLVLSLACMAAADDMMAPLFTHDKEGIQGQYLVALKENGPGVEEFLNSTNKGLVTIKPKKKYRGAAFKGFSAALDSVQLATIRRRPEVAYVEQDAVVRAQWVASWGLDRVDQRKLPLNGQAKFTGTGKGVNAYIIDTGIFPSNFFFNGRGHVAYDAVHDSHGGIDCNGHGSFCSGTIGAEVFGIARESTLYGVKVLGCGGTGSITNVVDGMDFVANEGKRPAVASMSLGGPASDAVDNAVKKLFDGGVVVSVAAGNNDGDACEMSPSRAKEAISVGATDIKDHRASFSNYGKCVDIFGPGVDTRSVNDQGTYGTQTDSGTSMACPHVSGDAVLAFGNKPGITAAEVKAAILKNGTQGVVIDPGPDSPNLFLYIP